MPFTVGQYLTANDLKSQEDAHTLGYGVVNGLKVVPDAPPSMDIDVEVGKCYAADTVVVKGAVTTLAVTAADPTNPRKDIVVCNSAGTLSIVAGTPEAALPSGNVGVYTLNPEPPNIPANSIILAEIWVPAGAAAITGAEIYDKRVSIADFLTHKDAATGVHGVGASTVCSVTEADGKITAHLAAANHLTFTELAGDEGHDPTYTGWRDWDISAIVPAGTKYVLVGFYNSKYQNTCGVRQNGTALLRIRKASTGSSNDYPGSGTTTMITTPDVNRVIGTYRSSSSGTFNILGYWSS